MRNHITAMLAGKVKTPTAANHWLRQIKWLMEFAVEQGYRKDNPAAAGIKNVRTPTEGFHTWTEDEIAQFEARHAVGSKARLALALLLYTAQRRSDVVRMGRQHIQNGAVQVRQQKTRSETVKFLCTLPLQAIHERNAKRAFDIPYDCFRQAVHQQRASAIGLGNAATRRACRSTVWRMGCARQLVGAGWLKLGAPANVIASIQAGMPLLTEDRAIRRPADQERMAQLGMAELTRTKSRNSQ